MSETTLNDKRKPSAWPWDDKLAPMPFVLVDDDRRRHPQPRNTVEHGAGHWLELILSVAFVIAVAMFAADQGCH